MRSLQREPVLLLALLAAIGLVLAFIVYPQIQVVLVPGTDGYVKFLTGGTWMKALQIDPAYAEAYNHMGSAFMKKGQAGEAIGYYQKAVQLNTNYADAYNNLGVAFLRNGQVDEAIADYRKAVAINPESAEMQYNLGNALAREGKAHAGCRCRSGETAAARLHPARRAADGRDLRRSRHSP